MAVNISSLTLATFMDDTANLKIHPRIGALINDP